MNLEEVASHYEDLKNIYGYALEAMQNYLGKPTYPFITQPKQLYPYILFLCEGLPDHEIVAVKQKISETQLLNIQLTVIVKEAKVIHPKITEFSHIFCKLWIGKDKEHHTTVKEASTYLLWDERFILDVTDYEFDVFHIEVWSFRPGIFEKSHTFNYESFKEDDPLAEEKGMYFLGDAFEYVKFLPCVGQSILWTLKRGPRRIHTKGQLTVFIQLGTKKRKDCILHLYCHMEIIRLCYEKQVLSDESSGLWKNWLEILPNAALTLIQQHALQYGITPVEQTLCSWLVTSSLKMREEDRISFYLLRDLLGYLLENIAEGLVVQMQEVLGKNISDFSVYTLDMLRDLHKNFDVQDLEMADELYYMLRCMRTIEFKKVINYVESYQAIEDEAQTWYLKVIAEVKKELEVDDSVEEMGEGLKMIMKVYLRNQIVLDDIFSKAWNVSYSSITYKRLDDVICTTVHPMIKHLMVILEDPGKRRKTADSLKMLQLYHNVRNLVNYIMTCIPSKKTFLRMDDYSSWFGDEMILEWFLLCDIFTHPYIERAVLADIMEQLNENIYHGTSVPDVASIIDELVVEVWMKLKWKDQFYTHGALIEAVKSCVLDYSKVIINRIKCDQYYCYRDEFEVTPKFCVALSNICAISEHLNKTKIKIRKELETAEAALGFKIVDPLIGVQSDLQIIIANIFLVMFDKIHKSIRAIMKRTVKQKIEFLSVGTGDLSTYTDNTLEVLYLNLKSEIFYVILRQMWIVALKNLKYGLKYSQGCFVTRKRKINIYMVTMQLFNQLKTIFYCDGHGLSYYEMENKISEELRLDLEHQLHVK